MIFFIITLLSSLLFLETNSAMKKPTFNEAMAITNQYVPERAEQDPLWQKITELYDAVPFHQARGKFYKIPGIIHHIWLGSELPQVCKEFRQTWIKHHPTWTHILWTDNTKNYTDTDLILTPQSFDEVLTLLNRTNSEGRTIVINIENLSFPTRDQYLHSENYGEKSDILRYEILFYIGGLYVDTDFKCLRPFHALHKSCSFFAGLDYADQEFNVFNGLIGSKKHHPICKACREAIQQQSLDRNDSNRGSMNAKIAIMQRTGPYFFSTIIHDYIMQTNVLDPVVLFPVTFFYPYPHLYIPKCRKLSTQQLEEMWLKPESIAIHFWHVSWDPNKKKS